ncbi:TraB/GumN family protein [Sphingomonas piscis]|uniref:TraB/GumN family protein n=1 Tax=Sphingomonas piscis TaxID=2714943 RepID=A0A6G7YLV4_9SPHN|nr:TraB/GumN family protein [Sphingomonas piscis]
MAGGFFTAIAAATLALGQPATTRPAIAHPALWAVQDEDTTIYLFGTFHALDERSDWFRDDVRAAFTISDELVLETMLPRLERTAPLAPRISIAPSANFLGAARMAVHAGQDRGLDVRKGADMVLRRAADDAGKPVRALETVQFQLGMLTRMAGPRTRTGAPLVMDDFVRAKMAGIITDMQGAWESGDQRIFTAMLGQMRQTSPAITAPCFRSGTPAGRTGSSIGWRRRVWCSWRSARRILPAPIACSPI